ncbi:phosphotransferase [Citricoccus sp. NPDC079358]|jgi:aminoglycoside phosphotransferase (APT) family kinase protein|uniref:phosphotransferase n=1 Tax=Citricoccus sp. NPDC079358 TaxID=3154653 RepID=UPI00344FD1AA
MTTSEEVFTANLQSLTEEAREASGLFDGVRTTVITPKMGRNVSGIFETPTARCFVKRFTGLAAGERWRNSRAFNKAGIVTSGAMRTPSLMFSHEPSATLIYEAMPRDATHIVELLRADELSATYCQALGAGLGDLHSAQVDHPEELTDAIPGLPPGANSAVPLDVVEQSTIGVLQLWGILQQDETLAEALADLVGAVYVPRPIHGDLRTDQIFHDGESVQIIDWEDLRMGDPARDVGSLLGEVLFNRLRKLTQRASDEEGNLTDENLMRSGAELVTEASESMRVIWSSYSTASGCDDLDEGMRVRTAQYVGWAMYERSMAVATYFGRLGAFERAIMGIGRNLLLNPDDFSSSIGLE